MSDSPNPISDYISYALAAAHREVHTSLSARLKEYGVQIEAWRVMETLDSAPAITMSELATLVLMNPPTLTKLVDRMVSDGLVHRQIARHDHRQVNLVLTDLGRKRMAQIRDQVRSQDDNILKSIGPENAATLIDLLRKIGSEGGEDRLN